MLHDTHRYIEASHRHPALCDGFHAAEDSHRWTDGLARVPATLLRPFAGPLTLELHLASSTLAYRVAAPERPHAAAAA